MISITLENVRTEVVRAMVRAKVIGFGTVMQAGADWFVMNVIVTSARL